MVVAVEVCTRLVQLLLQCLIATPKSCDRIVELSQLLRLRLALALPEVDLRPEFDELQVVAVKLHLVLRIQLLRLHQLHLLCL